MMLKDIIAFEWRLHTRQIAFIAASALFFAFGAVLTATGFGPGNVHVNSPYSITQSLALLSLPSLFVLAIFCSNAIVRDREQRMEEIVFSTAMGKFDFLFGRFAGSFMASVTVVAFSLAGMLTTALARGNADGRVAPVRILDYLWPFLVLVVPSMLFAAALIFAVATLTRNALASYVASVFIYVLYFVVAALTNSPLMASSAPVDAASQTIGALLDPFGLSAFFQQTQYWSPVERNARWVSLSGTFLANRIAAVAFATLLWTIVYRWFAFRVSGKTASRVISEDEGPSGRRHYTTASTGAPRAFLSTARIELRALFTNVPFLLLTLMWAALAASEIIGNLQTEHGSRLLATTSIVLEALERPLQVIGLITLIYLSTEIVWRERSVGFADILTATPAPSMSFVLAKWLAVSAVVVTMTLTGLLVALAVQLANGITPEVSSMLWFFWFNAVPLILFAGLTVFIHSVSGYKYVGLLLVLVAAAILAGGGSFGIPHNLWRFGSAPPVMSSEMNRFSPHTKSFGMYMLHWAVIAALLLIVAAGMWRARSLKALRRGSIAVLAVMALTSGGVILYNTNVLNAHESTSELMQWRAEYEKQYKRYEQMPQPRIERVEVNVALYPKEQRAHVRGRYLLVNDTKQPVSRVLVSARRQAKDVRLALTGTRTSQRDDRFGHQWFDLARPLAPGQRAYLSFDLTHEQRGFEDGGIDYSIVENGTYLTNLRALPVIGYRGGYEMREEVDRRKYGLPPSHREVLPDNWVTSDITLSTDGDQTAITSGRLVRAWTENGRSHFNYRSDIDMPNAFAFTSARYAVVKTSYNGKPIELYYHPPHRTNVDLMLRTVAESLPVFEKSFGPLRYGQLKLVEVPAYWPFGGFAMPDTIYFVENRTFLTDARDDSKLNLVYRRVAHEVAHQWWGHTVAATNVAGGAAITESLNKYAETLSLENAFGTRMARQSLQYELERYLRGRVNQKGAEPPLAQVRDEDYIFYGKGTIVMSGLRDLLGESRLNGILASFVAQQGGAGKSPTTRDLMIALQSAATPGEWELIEAWWTKVVLYDLDVTSADARTVANGTFEVAVTIRAKRVEVAPDGTETPIPLRENVSVAVDGQISRHTLTTGDNDIRLVVKSQPVSIEVDPDFTRVDRNRENNTRAVNR